MLKLLPLGSCSEIPKGPLEDSVILPWPKKSAPFILFKERGKGKIITQSWTNYSAGFPLFKLIDQT